MAHRSVQSRRSRRLRSTILAAATLAAGLLLAQATALPAPAAAFGGSGAPPASKPPPPALLPPDLPPGGLTLMCETRDFAIDELFDDYFKRFGLGDLFDNYYCEGQCYMCCWSPGTGGSGGCHTSFDYTDDGLMPVNCNPGTYGAGTTIIGEALVIGDPLGTGACIGGVQQLCNHFPVCNADGGTPGAPPLSAPAASNFFAPPAAFALLDGDTSGYEPPALPAHPSMGADGAAESRAKAFIKVLLQRFYRLLKEREAHLPYRDYVNLVMGRGAVDWKTGLDHVEPFDGTRTHFEVQDQSGTVLPHESYQKAVLYHAQWALVGAIPNLLTRLAYVESRFWTSAEIAAYLDGRDPEAELLQTMGPIVLETVKRVPVQDWRLLAVPAPGETPLGYAMYEGNELGSAPLVSVAEDCTSDPATTIAVRIDDASAAGVTTDELMIQWGDGSVTRSAYDPAAPSHTYSHGYALPGDYAIFVTADNDSGLRGVGALVVTSAGGAAPATPAIASLEFDGLQVYGPALITSGNLTLALEAEYADGTTGHIGRSASVTLANMGVTDFGRLVAYNDPQKPVTKFILRPTQYGQYFSNSTYFQVPRLALGFVDPELGETIYQYLPVDEDTLEVYYDGATAKVPPAQLERGINGALRFPVDRENPNLAAGFCGSTPCRKLDRIEIPVTAAMLALSPTGGTAPPGTQVGQAARFQELRPEHFAPVEDLTAVSVPGSCTTSLTPNLVAGRAAGESSIVGLDVSTLVAQLDASTPASVIVTATLIDGSQLDVTDRMTFTSDDTRRVRVSNLPGEKGMLSAGELPGTALVTASLGAFTVGLTAENLRPARGYSSYRFLITKVHGGKTWAGINALELMAEGKVLGLSMTTPTDGSIGPYPADVSASHGNAVGAFDANYGLGWSSGNGTFDAAAPYGVGPAPVYLQVNFEEPVPIGGIRMHRQGGILAASFAAQFPREVVIQGSLDGVHFDTLHTHYESAWDYQPMQIEWTVTAPPSPLAAVPLWPRRGLGLGLLGAALLVAAGTGLSRARRRRGDAANYF